MMGSEFLSLLSAVTKLNVALVVDVPLTLSATRLLAVASAAVTLAFTKYGVFANGFGNVTSFKVAALPLAGAVSRPHWIIKFPIFNISVLTVYCESGGRGRLCQSRFSPSVPSTLPPIPTGSGTSRIVDHSNIAPLLVRNLLESNAGMVRPPPPGMDTPSASPCFAPRLSKSSTK